MLLYLAAPVALDTEESINKNGNTKVIVYL